jgi:hypothetical protein
MDQLAVPSQQSPVTMDSAESAAAAVGSALLDDDYDAVPEPPACISSMIDRGGSVESHRLFLARRTALEMLRDRGYSLPESDLALTLPEFRAWWADRPELERLAITATLASDHSSKVTFSPPLAVISSSLCSPCFICSSIRVLSLCLGCDSNHSLVLTIRCTFMLVSKHPPTIDRSRSGCAEMCIVGRVPQN